MSKTTKQETAGFALPTDGQSSGGPPEALTGPGSGAATTGPAEAGTTSAPAEHPLDNTSTAEAKAQTPDLKVVGNGDMWQLLCKASSKREGWMRSTKALSVPGGVVLQVSTYIRNGAVSDGVCFVPGVMVAEDSNGGRKLVRLRQ